ncbi:DUF2243 domain-containing protein [Streptomyces solincola]|uniref:DUF2243 domain-containing protein n=1 Tax=Streptomyces solincola TaxID=2100817 RepID=A0A2S9Q0U5_9ACTN|nr:DUF2243 domain-containing protein [Streptomyces solincola]PRH80268.1 DUF2243 domain-containing protein [Streptomyces solincola]
MATTTGGARPGIARPASIRLPGIVLGVGLGGFVDGILLHQILQWHHMLSSTDQDRVGVKFYNPDTVPGLEMNTLWDGLFHTVCWLSVLLGLAILYARVTHHRRRVWTSRVLWGWMFVGWGLFNLVEGLLDHQILAIHHVYAGDGRLWWDLGFLALGALFVAGGYLLQRGGRPFDPDAPAGRDQARPA